MKTLRRWLGPIKRRLMRVVEAKSGIMLHQPVKPGATGVRASAMLALTTKYRQGLALSEGEFLRRTGQGNVLYELFVDGDPVCYGWVGQGGSRVGILHNLKLTVPDRAFYIWDCATLPDHRGRGHFQTLLKGLLECQGASSAAALAAVDTGNTASRKALEKAGFKPMFSYFSLRVGGRVLVSLAIRDGKLMRAQPEFDRVAGNALGAA
ncbi:Acetyltransferase (GNAT) family protein [Marinobacter zhejiangensis]|uniref:Acetyltransferase (GNAT) family protein n=2 Tax=Marinobacter zhejiangensis TaxID=488535 RepID=A0A1I4RNZ9_9GAMM|nr:Acetyltransferase (GNAT) family protein [Marinobacter zhejiangensis]